MRGKHPFFGIIVSFLILVISISPQMQSLYAMPEQVLLMEEGGAIASLPYPLSIELEETHSRTMPMLTGSRVASSPELVVRLFDLVPIKRVAVEMKPPCRVLVGGHSIGVTMKMNGVLVVGFSKITDVSGSTRMSARDAGVRIGDRIVAVNACAVQADREIARLVQEYGEKGQEIILQIARGDEEITILCHAIYCYETQSYRIGLFVRDNAVGIGTLTYCEPNTKEYGALGHIITDSDTNEAVICASGEIAPANVATVQQGEAGHPGEKIGTCEDDTAVWGTIERNTPSGIFGKMAIEPTNPLYPETVPIAAGSQVREGEAELLTVVDGERIEAFSVEIEKINPDQYKQGKNMLIHITDKNLIERTGGIVQGMSGSPIIQNGKLVGAVTHVLVNDPTRGYGILIENMLDAAKA